LPTGLCLRRCSAAGVRTLATDMGAYNPVSYHNGSVWPHDNALIVAGLMRYGFVKEAQQLSSALIEAAEYSDNRLPELFCGFSRSDYPQPLPYPTACSPPAWAAATPVMLIRSLLRATRRTSPWVASGWTLRCRNRGGICIRQICRREERGSRSMCPGPGRR
jgi:glycogen debranching enzyme